MSAPLTPERIAELRRLMEKATPGPWTAGSCEWNRHRANYKSPITSSAGTVAFAFRPRGDQWIKHEHDAGYDVVRAPLDQPAADAVLIAAMRNNFPALLDEAERAKDLDTRILGLEALLCESEKEVARLRDKTQG